MHSVSFRNTCLLAGGSRVEVLEGRASKLQVRMSTVEKGSMEACVGGVEEVRK